MSYHFGNRDNVWHRRGEGNLTERQYFAAYIGFTLYGLLLVAAVGWYAVYQFDLMRFLVEMLGPKLGIIAVLLLTLGVAFGGSIITHSSTSPAISLLGYTLVIVAFGFLIGPFTSLFEKELVIRAMFLTGALVTALGIVGFIFPTLLNGWGKWLFGALGLLVVVSFGQLGASMFGVSIPGGALTFIDYAAVALFSLYVIYDVGRARQLPPTLDNAIDSASALFMDIMNIFIRILAASKRS